MRDTVAHRTIRADLGPAGHQFHLGVEEGFYSASTTASMSPGGRYVEFATLVTGVYVRDLHLHTTRLVSIAPSGKPFDSTLTCGNCPGFAAGPVSLDGRFVAFEGDPLQSFPVKVWVRDRKTHVTVRADVGSPLIVDNSYATAITPDGHFLVFTNDNVSTCDANVFVRDLQARSTTLVGHWLEAHVVLIGPTGAIDDTGGLVSFASGDAGIVPSDTNGVFDAFLYDTAAATTQRVSLSASGAQLGKNSGSAQVSADGRYVVFTTIGAAVAADTNGAPDVYIRGPLS